MSAATEFLRETLDVLERTPAVLDRLLRGLHRAWLSADEGEGTWTPAQVVAHLIHAEQTDWIPRARIILEQGETAPFEPFDRFAHLAEPERPVEALLDRFAELRRESLTTLRGWTLDEGRLELRGRHPELGSVTLRQLLATWAVHDLGHIAQVVRVMARRYDESVGPWRAYLSILAR